MKNSNKIIGILGGMGPYATADIYKKLLDKLDVIKEWEYPHVIISSNPKIPSRTRAFLYNETPPYLGLNKEAKRLEKAGADFIIVPCNSAHYFLDKIRPGVNIPILDMVELTAKYIGEKTNFKKIGIVGGEVTMRSKMYDSHLKKYNIDTFYPTKEEEKILRSVIDDIKHNKITGETMINLYSTLISINASGAEAIIFACTELPLIFQKCPNITQNMIDPNNILIESALKIAGYKVKNDN